MTIDAAAFHPSTLTYWRRRLAASGRPHRIFEVVREVIAKPGVLAGRNRRALDSTVLDDAVVRQDTLTQLIAAVRRVGRVPGSPHPSYQALWQTGISYPVQTSDHVTSRVLAHPLTREVRQPLPVR